MKQYLFIFTQTHLDFRIPEFSSLCQLFGIPDKSGEICKDDVLCTIELEPNHVAQLLSRAISIKSVYEIILQGSDYGDICEQLKISSEKFRVFDSENQSWALRIRPYGLKHDISQTNEMIDELVELLPLNKASVNLSNPSIEFSLIEDFSQNRNQKPVATYFGRFIGEGHRSWISKFSLKSRKYIGNSTMDPELALIQANLVMARPGAIVLDPFCGTGGLILPASHFGATTVGTEINYQIARAEGVSARMGEGKLTANQSVLANFEQYGIADKFLGILIADASRHSLWRYGENGIFDAITTDPPYGVREKGRKVGNKKRKPHWTLPGSAHEQHYPEKQVYGITQVFLDLLNLAAKVLVISGRIAFWYPVVRNE
uniref:UPF0020 domain-containing protein n=1 Tax=Acrobeloides nanus TaxID=290746 RepID=A0A914C6L1_9BILA